MTSYILELKIGDGDDRLVSLYHEAVAETKTIDYKKNPHKDSGFDIYLPDGEMTILPGDTKLVNLKIKCAAYKISCDADNFPGKRSPTAFFIYPRSSIYKSQLRLANNTGIVDSGYRGNLMGAFDNISRIGASFPGGTWSQKKDAYNRFLQICMPDLSPFSVKIVDSLDDTTRGVGGFGSTGK